MKTPTATRVKVMRRESRRKRRLPTLRRPRRWWKTKTTRTQLTNGTGIVYDDNGEKVWVESTRVEVIESKNVNAAFTVLKQREKEWLVDGMPQQDVGPLSMNIPIETDVEKRRRLF